LAEISLGSDSISIDVIRKDFKLHYRKGMKLLKYVNECNSKVEE